MIGPAEIEDMRLDLADAQRARRRDELDPEATRRWGIVGSPPPPTDVEHLFALVDEHLTVPNS